VKYPALATILFCGGLMMTAEAQVIPTFERLPNNPIIRPTMLPGIALSSIEFREATLKYSPASINPLEFTIQRRKIWLTI
jgi:hypothetical protein